MNKVIVSLAIVTLLVGCKSTLNEQCAVVDGLLIIGSTSAIERSKLTKDELSKAVVEVREILKDPETTVSKIKIKMLQHSLFVQLVVDSLLKKLPVESTYLALTPEAKRMLNDGLDALDFSVEHYK